MIKQKRQLTTIKNMFLKNPFDSIRNIEKFTKKAVLESCPDCGSKKLSTVRENRGSTLGDRIGLYCEDCRVLWFNK